MENQLSKLESKIEALLASIDDGSGSSKGLNGKSKIEASSKVVAKEEDGKHIYPGGKSETAAGGGISSKEESGTVCAVGVAQGKDVDKNSEVSNEA
jgi:hypothetical protein